MFHNNPLLAQLKSQMQARKEFIEGVVQPSDKNFGFLRVKNDNYFIAPDEMKQLLAGDTIKASLESNGDRQKIVIEELIHVAYDTFSAEVAHSKEGRLQVILDDGNNYKRMPASVAPECQQVLKDGDFVRCKLVHHPVRDKRFFSAQIICLIAKKDEPFLPWYLTLERFNQPKHDVPEYDDLRLDDAKRADYSDKFFITIDSIDTLDMDDALCIECDENGNFTLLVAIADPTSYISETHPLDAIARERAFTNYLPRFNIPMLPRSLSDELCSLSVHQQRPVLLGILSIAHTGEIIAPITFEQAFITSKARLTYEEVADYLDGKTPSWQQDNPKLRQHITTLYAFAKARLAWRKQHSLIFSDIGDYQFVINDDASIEKIVLKERSLAHSIVEEAMIAANAAAGEFFASQQIPAIFNTHLGFKADNIEKVRSYITLINEENACQLPKEHIDTFAGYVELMQKVRQISPLVERNLRRFLSFAELSTEQRPHCGLGLELYATWTSPIRKYSDMINHRAIKATLQQHQAPAIDGAVVEHLQRARKTNRMVERETKNWLYEIFFSQKQQQNRPLVGEIFNIANAGIKVKLRDYGAIVFIAMHDICSQTDEYSINPLTMTLSINHRLRYRLGEEIMVQVVKSDVKNHQIYAKLAG